MSLSVQTFIERPRLALVLSILLSLCGGVCLLRMPVSEYPEITPPMVTVSATYPGATPQVLAETIATPIEDEVNSVDNVEYFDCRCFDTGVYELYVTFRPGSDPDINLVNVQNAVKRAEPKLPAEVVANGLNVRKSPQDCMAQYAFTTDGTAMSAAELGNYVKKQVAEAVQRVDGVSEVSCTDREYAMRVWLDPLKMSALGISAADVRTAIVQQNVQAAAGNVGSAFASKYLAFKINAKGRLATPEEFDRIVVRSDPERGARVLLSDIARCELGVKSYLTQERYGDRIAFFLSVYKAPEANAVATADRVKAEVDSWMRRLPKGVECHLSDDSTAFTRAFLRETFKTLVLALVLVVSVTFLFLQDWRATLVPAIAIPISLLGTFVFMSAAGYTLNVLTMFGLILVIGSLVDDAIVVVENAGATMEREGADARTAASRSIREIAGAIVATLFVTLACYAPFAFYDGMVGKMYVQFAVTMSIALVLSAFVALTLSPMLSSRLLRPRPSFAGWIFMPVNLLVRGGRRAYLALVRPLVAHPVPAFAAFAILVLSGLSFYRFVPGAFLPVEDRGFIKLEVELSEGSSLERTVSVLDRLHPLVETIPGVMGVASTAGSSVIGRVGENHAAVYVRLLPWDLRRDPAQSEDAVMDEIRRRLETIHEASFSLFKLPGINGLGGYGGVGVFLCAIGGTDTATLAAAAEAYAEKIRRWPGVKSVTTSLTAATPQLQLKVDRDKAQTMGIPASTVFSTLQSKLASFYVNDFNLRGGAYQVVVQGDLGFRGTVEDALDLRIPGADGAMVPLSSIARLEPTLGPRMIPRYNKMASAGVIVALEQGTTSLEIVDRIERDPPDPSKYALAWSTMIYQERKSRGQLGWLLACAAVFVYLILVAKYESWTLPLPVMLASFVAVSGAVFALWAFGESLSIYAQLGLVMLIELSAKNSILIVEVARQARERGLSAAEAALEAADRRYRAVMMTAWSFLLGVLPLVFASGAGCRAQQAMGLTTMSGMVAATFVGLVFVPALYVFFAGRTPLSKGGQS